MKNLRTAFWLLLGSAGLLSGCAVYVPTVPSTPLLRQKGEVEITAAVRNLSSLEASAAWSPVPHVLLLGEAASQTSETSETANNVTTDYHNRHRQGSLGLGTYHLLGPNQATYLGITGGVGYASADVYNSHLVIYFIAPVPSPFVHYRASYLRYYGQGYVAHLGSVWSYGLSARGTFVRYRKLERAEVAIDPLARFFLEPTLFVRVGHGAVQGLGTLGFSAPLGRRRQDVERNVLAPVTSLASVGVVVRPHFFRRRLLPAHQ